MNRHLDHPLCLCQISVPPGTPLSLGTRDFVDRTVVVRLPATPRMPPSSRKEVVVYMFPVKNPDRLSLLE